VGVPTLVLIGVLGAVIVGIGVKVALAFSMIGIFIVAFLWL